ncbi:Uncharacterized protein OBRU01_09713, partial [Operophtera brumata]
VIPMLNPDGVFLGNQRSDLLGADLNRSWDNATKLAHPGLIAVNGLIEKLTTEGKGIKLDFIIDIHADISHEGVFVRGNSYDDEACLFNADAAKVGSARRALPVGAVDAYTLLASLGGRRLTARGPYIHYTEDAYAKIGRSIAKALCDYYRHIGVIPPRIGSVKKEPKGRRRRKRPVTGKERSPSSSPERRAVPPRVLSPPLPAASPAFNVLPPRTAKHWKVARPRTLPDVCDSALPIITGTAVKTPRLSVVDMSAYIRTPAGFVTCHLDGRARRARAPRPQHARLTSDEDTHDSDSDHKH